MMTGSHWLLLIRN